MLAHSLFFDVFNFIHFISSGPDSASSSDTFKTAIVITAGTVLSAGFGALAIIVPKHRESGAPAPTPAPTPTSGRIVDPGDAFLEYLKDRVTALEAKAEADDKIISGQAAMIERLRDLCWANRIDPIRMRKMRQGETRETNIAP